MSPEGLWVVLLRFTRTTVTSRPEAPVSSVEADTERHVEWLQALSGEVVRKLAADIVVGVRAQRLSVFVLPHLRGVALGLNVDGAVT